MKSVLMAGFSVIHDVLDAVLKRLRRLYWGTKLGNHVYVNPPFVLDGSRSNVKFGYGVTINPFCLISVAKDAQVVIGDHVRISAGSKLFTHGLDVETTEGRRGHVTYGDIIIGKNVWIGANTVIIGGITVGDGAVIAAGSFVNQSIPAKAVFGGVPARQIKQIGASPRKAGQ